MKNIHQGDGYCLLFSDIDLVHSEYIYIYIYIYILSLLSAKCYQYQASIG